VDLNFKSGWLVGFNSGENRMKMNLKFVCTLLVAVALSALQSGCGEKGETNPPAVKLTASTVASSTVNSHTHSVSIPFADVSDATVSSDYQYRSYTASDGHSHVIALSNQQMIDLNNGKQMILNSSLQNSGVDHTHTWSLLGGSVLYERTCYNCHSNDHINPTKLMNDGGLNAAQKSALKSPGSAPASLATPAIPDATYVPPTTVTRTGAQIFAGICSMCHSLTTTVVGPPLSGKGALVSGKFPTAGVASHHSISLTAVEITTIIGYLNAN
jgi:mono/diheme cytochrome c family protein